MRKTMARRIVHAVLALVFGWQALVFLAPAVLGVIHLDRPTGEPALGVATILVGLACLGAALLCLRRLVVALPPG